MHVLTKLFIVLVSLLSVLLVPLVVVYAHNEDSYRSKYLSSEAQNGAIRSAFESAKASHGAILSRKDAEIQALEVTKTADRRELDQRIREVQKLEAQVVEANAMDSRILAQLSTLSAAVDAGQQLNESLIGDLRSLRTDSLASKRQQVELDEALRDALAKLDAEQEARRALQEELTRLKQEHANAMDQIAQYIASGARIPTGGTVAVGALDDLDATIVAVNRSADRVYAEIDAGSRDKVKVGWEMTISSGGNFIATLRITDVDINRSTGIVELEDPLGRGEVRTGQRAFVRKSGF